MKRNKLFIKNRKGFTMTELLVSLSIFGLISSVALMVVNNVNHFKHINSQIAAQDDAKSALFLMSRDIRASKSFETSHVQPTSLAFITMNGGAISYYINTVTNELIKEYSQNPDIPLVAPITRMTILRDVQPVHAGHPRIFDYTGKMIMIDLVMDKPFVKNTKENMRFKTEVCVRNP
ncbi:MAG: prepilin-type N-terminal cleavage/methylation domain-containing protein [bacterium]